MSEIKLVDFGPVKNGKVYDFWESVTASKYPMSPDVEKVKKVTSKEGVISVTNKIAMAPIGSGHDQFLTGIRVAFDLTLSVEAWNCAQRYHFFDFVSSQSKMHRALKFDLDQSVNFDPHVDKRIIDILKEKRAEYEALPDIEKSTDKELDFTMSLPIGFRLTARMTTNYRQLKTIYSQRKKHKLPELRAFCSWMKTLPMFQWITGEEDEEFKGTTAQLYMDDFIEWEGDAMQWKKIPDGEWVMHSPKVSFNLHESPFGYLFSWEKE